ncbi:MAG TPA: hypothetical protein VGO03_05700 [Acidimicrobiia bacterium]
MADIVYVAIIVAFFALATLFVHACDKIIGPDETATVVSGREPDAVPAESDGHGNGSDPVVVGAGS